jgi:hypothetical protein
LPAYPDEITRSPQRVPLITHVNPLSPSLSGGNRQFLRLEGMEQIRHHRNLRHFLNHFSVAISAHILPNKKLQYR